MNEYVSFKMDELINILKPNIIEVFVTFYGEKEREYIENKFNNTIFIGYISREGYDNLNDRLSYKGMQLPILDNSYIQERINEYNFLLPIDLNEVLSKHLTSFCPNCIEDEGKLIEKDLLFFYGDRNLQLFDGTFIHECNHIYESSVTRDDEFIKVCSGWDECSTRNPEQIRSYLEINEMINDLIAEDITKMLHDKGIYLLGKDLCEGNITDAEYSDKSSFIIKDFYDKYKTNIIDSRKDNNINRLFEVVGEDNFNKLNSLINEHMIWLNTNRINEMEELIQAHYKDILLRKDKILEDMDNYNN